MEAIKAYLERIKNIPVLTKKEEVELIIKAKRGNKPARRKLINSNLKLVVNIAKHYSRFALPLMDLIAEGNIGLMKSIDKFNVKKGYRFSTYAAWWIRQGITRALIDQGKTIRIPVYMSELIAKYKKTIEKLRQKLKREPAPSEVARRMRLPVEKIHEIEMWRTKKASLETPIGKDGESELGDFIRATGYSDTESEVDKFFQHERVMQLLDIVNDRERKVLDLRFGITDGKAHTLAEVSKVLKVSRERVRQIEEAALKKLKKYALEQQKQDVDAS
ncbi:MAG: sigma-70 family RNA polymerase sigma factor [Candidatus Omnitrophica bacterium]|nr:sigma-70 family RNA polymerase sigma factor [Candidatus Omnitrophota bacterium]